MKIDICIPTKNSERMLEKDRSKLKTKVTVQMCVNTENYRSILDMVGKCIFWGIDRLEITDITYSYNFGTSVKEKSLRIVKKEEIEKLKPLIEIKRKYIDINLNLSQPKYRTCYWGWLAIYIDVQGDMHPCCDTLDWNLGNIYTDDMKSVFNSDKMNEFRRKSVAGLIPSCNVCTAWSPGECPILKRFLKKVRS